MDSAGERLKKIRLEKGLSLEQASKKTKIHIDILGALEEGRLINKVPVYVKGFIKIYCEFLGAEPKDFIEGYQKPEIKEDYPKPPLHSILPKPSVRVSKFETKYFKIIKILAVAVLCVAVLLTAVKLVKKAKTGTTRPDTKKTDITIAKKTDASNMIRLNIRARENCWIKARVDGKVSFVDTLKKGRSETWMAEEKIELSLGNAGGIDLELNGEVISPLGRKGQVIRQILITREGLKIIR